MNMCLAMAPVKTSDIRMYKWMINSHHWLWDMKSILTGQGVNKKVHGTSELQILKIGFYFKSEICVYISLNSCQVNSLPIETYSMRKTMYTS